MSDQMSLLEDFLTSLAAARAGEIPHDNPAWQRMQQDPAITFSKEPGGNCPVQIYVTVDGFSCYFRARGTHWSFQAATLGKAAPCGEEDALFQIKNYYGEWPSAGWMSMGEAAEFLEQAIQEFRCSPAGRAHALGSAQ
jgi:hypothetical protein